MIVWLLIYKIETHRYSLLERRHFEEWISDFYERKQHLFLNVCLSARERFYGRFQLLDLILGGILKRNAWNNLDVYLVFSMQYAICRNSLEA